MFKKKTLFDHILWKYLSQPINFLADRRIVTELI